MLSLLGLKGLNKDRHGRRGIRRYTGCSPLGCSHMYTKNMFFGWLRQFTCAQGIFSSQSAK